MRPRYEVEAVNPSLRRKKRRLMKGLRLTLQQRILRHTRNEAEREMIRARVSE